MSWSLYYDSFFHVSLWERRWWFTNVEDFCFLLFVHVRNKHRSAPKESKRPASLCLTLNQTQSKEKQVGVNIGWVPPFIPQMFPLCLQSKLLHTPLSLVMWVITSDKRSPESKAKRSEVSYGFFLATYKFISQQLPSSSIRWPFITALAMNQVAL